MLTAWQAAMGGFWIGLGLVAIFHRKWSPLDLALVKYGFLAAFLCAWLFIPWVASL
jgi:hypothetical protein